MNGGFRLESSPQVAMMTASATTSFSSAQVKTDCIKHKLHVGKAAHTTQAKSHGMPRHNDHCIAPGSPTCEDVEGALGEPSLGNTASATPNTIHRSP